ncbi:MAG: PadR family transcriptional regulator [Gaiellales bacterium]|nr:PadR family transcriptional regulator [Gaiellales bacterium]
MGHNCEGSRTGPTLNEDAVGTCPRLRGGAGRGRLRQGLLQTALLSRLAEGEAHGYSLIDSAASLIGRQACVDPGTVYRILRALEAEGCVTSHWESPTSGPGRRVYEIMPAGLDLLRTWCVFLERRAEGLLAVARWGRSALGEPPFAGAGQESAVCPPD